MKIKRKCDNCGKEYDADTRNLKRGWDKCCNKSCAAALREKSKPGYDPVRVQKNNIRRLHWNDVFEEEDDNFFGYSHHCQDGLEGGE